YKSTLSYYKLATYLKDYLDDTIIICIGTDKCIGDSLGPLTGTLLKENNCPIPVYGTLENPIHALNLELEVAKIKLKHPTSKIIAIDACIGNSKAIGEIQIRPEGLKPGKGVGKALPIIGDLSIIGIIDTSDITCSFSNRVIRLNFIMEMSKVITYSFLSAYTLNVL
ncbi:MAG: spore protease YyaC, partial [Sarcina sp.]